tara:strand:- start:42155 stop:43372 length:1218 start_codon:yes stop_codon:yes gene_type:complete
MIAILNDPNTWISLLILTMLEIVLGIDNIVFILIASNRLPKEQQKTARRLGLGLAMIMRLLLLGGVFWLSQLTKTWFMIGSWNVSGRDFILFVGGLFLLYKGCHEIINYLREHQPGHKVKTKTATMALVLTQIILLDIVFSLDSVITAVAVAKVYMVMAVAIIIAVFVMMWASEPLNNFLNRFPRVKLLALIFITLVGVFLIVQSFNVEVSHYYLYGAMLGLAIVILPNWFPKEKNGLVLHGLDRTLGVWMWISAVGYFIGIFAPLVTLTALWVFSNTVSMTGGMVQLFNTGNYFIFGLILIFSFIFPIVKMIAILFCWFLSDWQTKTVRKILWIAENIGRWSMLDVLVVALMVIIVRLGVAGTVSVQWGVYVFSGSIILMLLVSARFHYLVKRLWREKGLHLDE